MEPQGLGCKTFTEIQATPSPRISQAHLPLLGTLLSGMPSACLIFTVVSFVETWIPSILVYPPKNDSTNQKSQPPRDEVSVCWKAYWPNHHLANWHGHGDKHPSLHKYHQNGGCSIAMYTKFIQKLLHVWNVSLHWSYKSTMFEWKYTIWCHVVYRIQRGKT